MQPLIPPTQTFAMWTVLLAAAAFGLYMENTRLGKKLSGAVMTMTATFVLSNLGIISAENVPAYDVVWSYLVPLAIPLLLFQANIRRIIKEAGPTLIAFLIGTMGTIAGALIAFYAIPLGPEGAKLAGIFAATYIGGSINYAAVSEAVGLRSGDLLSAGVAADNLVMVLYFLVLFALPSSKFLRKLYPERSPKPSVEMREDSQNISLRNTFGDLPAATLAIASGTLLCSVGYGLAKLVGFETGGILFVTALTVAIATAFPKRLEALKGADVIGSFLMQIFFAVIGASANVQIVLKVGPWLFVFAALILTVHLAVMLIGGYLLRLDLLELVIASNANMGGPTTAAAMATARRWDRLILPAILSGTFGYAIATFLGVGVTAILQ